MVRAEIYQFSAIIIGPRGAGKSTAVARFAFNCDLPTSVVRMAKKQLDPLDSYRIMKLEGDRINSALAIEVHRIPDIATRFQINWKKNILQCEGIIVMYSVTSLSSLATASGHLNLVFEVRGRPDFPVVLVGNKCDLQSKRDVSYEQGQEIARQFGIPFFETSANEVKTVEEPFRQICSEIRKDRLAQDRLKAEPPMAIKPYPPPPPSPGCIIT